MERRTLISEPAVEQDQKAGKTNTRIGCILLVLACLCFIFQRYTMPVLAYGLLVFGILALLAGKGYKDRIKRMTQYADMLTQQNVREICQLAQAVRLSENMVIQDMNWNDRHHILPDVTYDRQLKRVSVKGETVSTGSGEGTDEGPTVLECPGCGARNTILDGNVGVCEYCGSPIGRK